MCVCVSVWKKSEGGAKEGVGQAGRGVMLLAGLLSLRFGCGHVVDPHGC